MKGQDSETPAIFRPQIHNLMVLQGSGGHTTEMLTMLKAYTKFDNIAYRLHVVTQGDNSSRKQILDFEDWRASQRTRVSGAYDIHTIPRARMVGQSWLTTPFTFLGSFRGIWDALRVSLPLSSSITSKIQYPDAILMNGPGTAFVVAAIVHMMKILSIIPLNRAHIIYVESFTRVDSLSLTGKLLWWSDMADIFITQHKGVAARYGLVCEPNFSARNFDSEIQPSY
jgi:beta-1,4-N-acetylglucosaminyltransferase